MREGTGTRRVPAIRADIIQRDDEWIAAYGELVDPLEHGAGAPATP